MARRLANLHDDRGFDVSLDVESGARSPREAFDEHYAWRLRELSLQFYTVGGDSPVFTGGAPPLTGTLRRIDHLRTALIDHPDDIVVIEHRSDLERVVAGEARGLVLTMEGGAPLGDGDTSLLRTFHRLGLRSINLLWFPANAVGDGVGEPRGAGLTGFGRAVVLEMNRLGMLPDVSQASVASCRDITELATVPVIASHSNARGRHDHPRNLSDEELRAIAATDGLVGLNGFPAMVDDGEPDLEQLLDHALYVADLVGPAHVCFGLNIIPASVDAAGLRRGRVTRSASHSGPDRSGVRHLPSVDDVTALPRLADALAARGLDDATVEMITFGNIVRVLEAVLPEAPARVG